MLKIQKVPIRSGASRHRILDYSFLFSKVGRYVRVIHTDYHIHPENQRGASRAAAGTGIGGPAPPVPGPPPPPPPRFRSFKRPAYGSAPITGCAPSSYCHTAGPAARLGLPWRPRSFPWGETPRAAWSIARRPRAAVAFDARLPRYCSRVQDPAAWRIDAFPFRWEGFRGYAFPPIALIPCVLRKVREDQAGVVLIAPWWPRRSWPLDLIGLPCGVPEDPARLPGLGRTADLRGSLT